MDQDLWRQWWRAHGAAELRLILRRAWDPIGTVELADDYESFPERIGALLLDGADGHAVAEYLASVEARMMRSAASTADLEPLAELIAAWYRQSVESFEREQSATGLRHGR